MTKKVVLKFSFRISWEARQSDHAYRLKLDNLCMEDPETYTEDKLQKLVRWQSQFVFEDG